MEDVGRMARRAPLYAIFVAAKTVMPRKARYASESHDITRISHGYHGLSSVKHERSRLLALSFQPRLTFFFVLAHRYKKREKKNAAGVGCAQPSRLCLRLVRR